MIKKFTTLMTIALAAICFSSIATAQPDANPQSEAQQQAQQLQQEYQEKAARLQQIHDETLAENEDLKQQQEDFVDTVREEINNQGYNIDEGSERVQEMTQKLQSGDLDDDERQALMDDFKAEREEMSQARDKALNKPEIKKAGEKLQQDTLDAMKAHDADTESLMQDMDNIREKLTKLMQQSGQ